MEHYRDYTYEILIIRTGQRSKPIDAELWYFRPGAQLKGTPTFFRRFSGATEFDAGCQVKSEFRAWVTASTPAGWPQKCRRCATILAGDEPENECEKCCRAFWSNVAVAR